jgi:hypothetical protein
MGLDMDTADTTEWVLATHHGVIIILHFTVTVTADTIADFMMAFITEITDTIIMDPFTTIITNILQGMPLLTMA